MTEEEILKIYQNAVDEMDLNKMMQTAFTDNYGLVPVIYKDTTNENISIHLSGDDTGIQ